jgi:hypothetical protein
MPETPEQEARSTIDANLTAAGWLVQQRAELDLTAERGIAVCEFPMKVGFGAAAAKRPAKLASGPRTAKHRRTARRGRPRKVLEPA